MIESKKWICNACKENPCALLALNAKTRKPTMCPFKDGNGYWNLKSKWEKRD